jgi:hypothetical protein
MENKRCEMLEIHEKMEKHEMINSLTRFDNFELHVPLNESQINVMTNNEMHKIILEDNPIIMMIKNNTLEIYMFLVKNLKNVNDLNSFDQCVLSLNLMMVLVSVQSDSLYIIEDDMNSMIGDHIIETDKLRLEYMKQKIISTDRQLIEKKFLLNKKLQLNKDYNLLLHEIKEFQKGIDEYCESIGQNVDDETKSMMHEIKKNKNEMKTLHRYCEASDKLLKMQYKDHGIRIKCPISFWKSIEPRMMDIAKNVKMFNVHNTEQKLDVKTYLLEKYVLLLEFESKRCQSDIIRQLIENTLSLMRNHKRIIEYDKTSILDKNMIEKIQNDQSMFQDIKDQITFNQSCQDDSHTKIVHDMMKKYAFIQPHTIQQMVNHLLYHCKKINIINLTVFKKHETMNLDKNGTLFKNKMHAIFNSMPIEKYIVSSNKNQYQWGNNISCKLNMMTTQYIRKRICEDQNLSLQLLLLHDTIQYINNVLKIKDVNMNDQTFNTDYHIKGGFCRDLILSYLSESGSGHNDFRDGKIFKKSIKDIDVAMNIDPEIFTYYFCQIAVSEYNIYPMKRWNNAEKNEKGKNISVWSVKIIPDYEAIEFVHFRTDVYDPETGGVEAIDTYDSMIDDTRRDVPWPSFRLRDFIIVDYFDIIGMLNQGEFVIRTPPIQSEMYQFKICDSMESGSIEPVNIINAQINYQTHIESAERVLRMFKFISSPFDSDYAYDYDIETNRFKKIHHGFKIHDSLMKMYQNPVTEDEKNARTKIYQYIKKWLDNNILSNVFKSIESIIRFQPDMFFQHLESIGLIEILFDDNYHMENVIKYTQVLKKMFQRSNMYFTLPYQILGIGARNKTKMLELMKKLSLSNETQKMAEILMDYSDIFFAQNNNKCDQIKSDKRIIETFYQILSSGKCNIYLIELMNIMGLSIDQFDNQKIIELIKCKTDRTKIIKSLQIILTDHISLALLYNPDAMISLMHDKYVRNILNLISWVLCVPVTVSQILDHSNKQIKNISNIIGSIVKKNLSFSDDNHNYVESIIDFYQWFDHKLDMNNILIHHVSFADTIVDHLLNICKMLNSLDANTNANAKNMIKNIVGDKILSNDQKINEVFDLIGIKMIDFDQLKVTIGHDHQKLQKILKNIDSLK